MAGIKMIGMDELQAKLKANCNLNDVRRVVQVNGDELNKKMKRKTTTAFTKGYTTGDTANSINTEIRRWNDGSGRTDNRVFPLCRIWNQIHAGRTICKTKLGRAKRTL